MHSILIKHKTVIISFEISTAEEGLDFSKLYWIAKLHKDPYKRRYIAGSVTSPFKSLSQLLTKILMAEKDGL